MVSFTNGEDLLRHPALIQMGDRSDQNDNRLDSECRMRHKRTQTQVECTCSSKSGADADVVATDIVDDEEEFDSEFDEEDDEAILKAMLLAQEYYLLYGDEGNITSCAKVEHDLMFRQGHFHTGWGRWS